MAITYHAGKRIQGLVVGTTFEDNFSTDQWDDLSTAIAVNVSTGVIDWDSERDVANCTVYDLGAGNVSDSKWILRFKFSPTTVTSSGGTGIPVYVGLSDSDENATGSVSQDSISLRSSIDTSAGATYKGATGDGANMESVVVSFATVPSVGSVYVELIRTSATTATCEIFSDSAYTTSVESENMTVSSTCDNLRYIKVSNYNGVGSTGSNDFIGTIDDVEFYNNASSVADAYTKFQTGSRWEETGTRNILHLDSVGWKDVDGIEATNYRSASWYEQLSGETP